MQPFSHNPFEGSPISHSPFQSSALRSIMSEYQDDDQQDFIPKRKREVDAEEESGLDDDSTSQFSVNPFLFEGQPNQDLAASLSAPLSPSSLSPSRSPSPVSTFASFSNAPSRRLDDHEVVYDHSQYSWCRDGNSSDHAGDHTVNSIRYCCSQRKKVQRGKKRAKSQDNVEPLCPAVRKDYFQDGWKGDGTFLYTRLFYMHNHPPPQTLRLAPEVKAKVQIMISANGTPAAIEQRLRNEAVAAATAQGKDVSTLNLSAWQPTKRQVSNLKQAARLSNVASTDEAVNLATLYGDSFLLHYSPFGRSTGFLALFATADQLKLLGSAASDTIFFDSTFNVSQRDLCCSTVLVSVDGVAVPAAYAVHEKKTGALYSLIFRLLVEETNQRFQVQALFSDFDRAIANGAEAVWHHVQCFGDLFHFVQANRKHLLGIQGTKEELSTLTSLLRGLYSAASRPEFDLLYDSFITYWNAHNARFCSYFKRTWGSGGLNPPTRWARFSRPPTAPSGDAVSEAYHSRMENLKLKENAKERFDTWVERLYQEALYWDGVRRDPSSWAKMVSDRRKTRERYYKNAMPRPSLPNVRPADYTAPFTAPLNRPSAMSSASSSSSSASSLSSSSSSSSSSAATSAPRPSPMAPDPSSAPSPSPAISASTDHALYAAELICGQPDQSESSQQPSSSASDSAQAESDDEPDLSQPTTLYVDHIQDAVRRVREDPSLLDTHTFTLISPRQTLLSARLRDLADLPAPPPDVDDASSSRVSSSSISGDRCSKCRRQQLNKECSLRCCAGCCRDSDERCKVSSHARVKSHRKAMTSVIEKAMTTQQTLSLKYSGGLLAPGEFRKVQPLSWLQGQKLRFEGLCLTTQLSKEYIVSKVLESEPA